MSSVPGPGACLDRQSVAGSDRRGAAAPAVVAHHLALGAGIGAVSSTEWGDLALRSVRRLDAAVDDRHFRGPARLRQVGAREHDQYRALPVVGGPRRLQGQAAADRQARHRTFAEGFVRLIQEALGPARRHEAIFTTMQFAPGYEFNAFDLQVGCEYPLPLEKAFLQNFLALLTLPPDETTPFEGMAQMISLVIDEAYRRCTEVPDGRAEALPERVEPLVDKAIDEHGVKLDPADAFWRDVVNALCEREEFRLAEIAPAPCGPGARGPDRGVPLRTGAGHVPRP